MSDPAGDAITTILAALRAPGATAAGQNVHDSLTRALKRETDLAIVVREETDVVDDSRSSHAYEGHRLTLEVIALARTVTARRSLSREVGTVLASVAKELGIEGSANVQFGEIGEAQGQVLDRPVFSALRTLAVPYRITWATPP
jgi:ADP-ribose pyrophosphatase YjhB (NUDIX family)